MGRPYQLHTLDRPSIFYRTPLRGVFSFYNGQTQAEGYLRFVQDQAGHASPTTTAIYAKTNNTARKRQVGALDEEEL
ncbi:MAG: hypothetical protein FVQ84_20270 [Planctomycetes bacterium]|nr:hypothetical protein [Planctomycetota bacterium]